MTKVERAEKRRARRLALKIEILTHYSTPDFPICKCCGTTEPDFLTIDHIDGGGNAHRKQTGASGQYSWIKKNGYPAGFQVLCFNCNFSKWNPKNGGRCIHAIDREKARTEMHSNLRILSHFAVHSTA